MALIDQSDLPALPVTDWRRGVHDDLASRLTPPSDFPCTFSQNAFRRELLQLSFIDRPGQAGWADGAADLRCYLAQAATWDGRVNSARPLLMVFSDKAASFGNPEGYRDFGWQVLQYWHGIDTAPWPEGVAQEPHSPFWSFCYAGTQLFVNMSTPLHKRRQSRNLGRYFTLVINPRERFDVVAGNSPEGRRVRHKIRERAEIYDGMPHAPHLGLYQAGDLEWVQYYLPDDDDTSTGACPFQQRIS